MASAARGGGAGCDGLEPPVCEGVEGVHIRAVHLMVGELVLPQVTAAPKHVHELLHPDGGVEVSPACWSTLEKIHLVKAFGTTQEGYEAKWCSVDFLPSLVQLHPMLCCKTGLYMIMIIYINL